MFCIATQNIGNFHYQFVLHTYLINYAVVHNYKFCVVVLIMSLCEVD